MCEHLLELGDGGTAWHVDEGQGRWRQVLVGVESSDGSDVGNVRYLNHCVLLAVVADVLVRRERRKRVWTGVINGIVALIIMVISILIPIIVTMFLEFLGHWWKGDTLWQVGQRIDEASLLVGPVIEGASFTELAFTRILPVLAWDRLVVRVHCAESCLAEVLWQRLQKSKESQLDAIIYYLLKLMEVEVCMALTSLGCLKSS